MYAVESNDVVPRRAAGISTSASTGMKSTALCKLNGVPFETAGALTFP